MYDIFYNNLEIENPFENSFKIDLSEVGVLINIYHSYIFITMHSPIRYDKNILSGCFFAATSVN